MPSRSILLLSNVTDITYTVHFLQVRSLRSRAPPQTLTLTRTLTRTLTLTQMASNMTRIVTLWIICSRYTAESRCKQHALCRTLGYREHQEPTHFPSLYSCSGDDDSAMCTSVVVETPRGNNRQVSVHDVVRYDKLGLAIISRYYIADMCSCPQHVCDASENICRMRRFSVPTAELFARNSHRYRLK